MRLSMKKCILWGLGWVGSCSAWASSNPGNLHPYQYWVRIPATSRSCDQEAAEIAARFKGATQASQVRGTCRSVVDAHFDGISNRLYSVLVDYQAEYPIDPYSALVGGLFDTTSASIEQAGYRTYAECLSDMAAQNANYERETGLAAVASFCTTASIVDRGYTLQIDGFGKPKRTLQVFHLSYGSEIDERNQEVRSLLVSLGAHVVRYAGNATLYYAENPLPLRQLSFGLFSNPKECEVQKEVVADLFMATGSKSRSALLIHCDVQSESGGSTALFGIADGYGRLEASEAPQRYYSFEECMQDRERAIQSTEGYGKAIGAVCHPNLFVESQYSMDIYRQ